MAWIEIRDVPEAGLAERPTMAEIVRRAQAQAQATGSTVKMGDAVAAVRAARDGRQEP
jgi:hypothetical protein